MSERKFTIPKEMVDDLIADKYPGLKVKTYDLGNNVTLVMFPGSIPLCGDVYRVLLFGEPGVIQVLEDQELPVDPIDKTCWRLWENLRLIEKEINSQPERQAEQVPSQSDIPPGAIRRIGRPSLDEDELSYRLKKAAEAKKLRETVQGITWKEVASQIEWKYGDEPPAIKLLQDAVYRLKAAKPDC